MYINVLWSTENYQAVARQNKMEHEVGPKEDFLLTGKAQLWFLEQNRAWRVQISWQHQDEEPPSSQCSVLWQKSQHNDQERKQSLKPNKGMMKLVFLGTNRNHKHSRAPKIISAGMVANQQKWLPTLQC